MLNLKEILEFKKLIKKYNVTYSIADMYTVDKYGNVVYNKELYKKLKNNKTGN